jgi:hypothetical protein
MNGQVWAQYICKWPGPEAGSDAVTLTEPRGLRSGNWDVAISVDGAVLFRQQIVIEGNWDYWEPPGTINSCYSKVSVQATPAPSANGQFGPEAVWNAPTPNGLTQFEDCFNQAGSKLDCVISVMQTSGARPQAIEFTRLLQGQGFMTAFTEDGTVDLAMVMYPGRMSDSVQYVLVNGTPPLVLAEDVWKIDITRAGDYMNLAEKYPQVMIWASTDRFDHVEKTPDGGQRFVFSYPLVNGCHACAVVGHALVAFDFNSQGKFSQVTLVALGN